MNRRHFFGLTAAAVAALGLPEIVLPDRQIFLPPSGGWFSGIRMREMGAYIINKDEYRIRHDVLTRDPHTGEYLHYYVESKPVPHPSPPYGETEAQFLARSAAANRELARKLLTDMVTHKGLLPMSPMQAGSPLQLKLPGGMYGAYVS